MERILDTLVLDLEIYLHAAVVLLPFIFIGLVLTAAFALRSGPSVTSFFISFNRKILHISISSLSVFVFF